MINEQDENSYEKYKYRGEEQAHLDEEQPYLDSESAKAIADVEAKIEREVNDAR